MSAIDSMNLSRYIMDLDRIDNTEWNDSNRNATEQLNVIQNAMERLDCSRRLRQLNPINATDTMGNTRKTFYEK